jgi:hypothetical protein
MGRLLFHAEGIDMGVVSDDKNLAHCHYRLAEMHPVGDVLAAGMKSPPCLGIEGLRYQVIDRRRAKFRGRG